MGRQYWFYKICYKKKAYIQHIYLDSGTANHFKHILKKHNISNGPKKKAKLGQSVFKQLHFQANKPEN